MRAGSSAGAHPARILVVLLASILAYSLLQMMVVPAMPEIQEQLDTDAVSIAWLISAFLLAGAVVTPIFGRLGDIFGKKRILLVVLAIFATGSLIGALAPTLEVLVAGRVLQGMGAAVFPLCFGIARDEMPPAQVTMAISLLSGGFGVGASLGNVICGPLIELTSWHGIFWLSLVVALLAIVATWLLVPESPIRNPARIDLAGAALLATGLLMVLIAVSRSRDWGWGSPTTVGLIGGGCAILGFWARHQYGTASPLIDVRLLASRPIWPTNAATVLFGFTMFAIGFLVPQFVQHDPASSGFGLNATVTEAGLFLLPASVALLFVAPIAGHLCKRLGAGPTLRLGLALMTGGCLCLALLHDTALQIYVGITFSYGIGLGFVTSAAANQIIASAPATQTGEAAGINATVRAIGGSFGSQIVAVIITAGGAGLATSEAGFTAAFVVCGVACTLGLAVSLKLPRAGAAGGGGAGAARSQPLRSSARRSIRA